MDLNREQGVMACSFLDACSRARIIDGYAVIKLKEALMYRYLNTFMKGLRAALLKIEDGSTIAHFDDVSLMVKQWEASKSFFDEEVTVNEKAPE